MALVIPQPWHSADPSSFPLLTGQAPRRHRLIDRPYIKLLCRGSGSLRSLLCQSGDTSADYHIAPSILPKINKGWLPEPISFLKPIPRLPLMYLWKPCPELVDQG